MSADKNLRIMKDRQAILGSDEGLHHLEKGCPQEKVHRSVRGR